MLIHKVWNVQKFKVYHILQMKTKNGNYQKCMTVNTQNFRNSWFSLFLGEFYNDWALDHIPENNKKLYKLIKNILLMLKNISIFITSEASLVGIAHNCNPIGLENICWYG